MSRINNNSQVISSAGFTCALWLACSLLLVLSMPATAQQAANEITTPRQIQTDTAIIHELKGSATLRKINKPVSPIQLNQRLGDGNILDIAKESLIEITYNNGCSEIVDQAKSHKIDACACQTSKFRKGIRDLFNATLKDIAGEVLIFQGERYVPATENLRVRNGDRIMVMSSSSATISYDSGCKQDVSAFSVTDVNGCSLECPLMELVERLPHEPVPTPQPMPVQAPPAPLPPSPMPAAIPPAPIPPTPIPPVPAPVPVVNPGLIAGVIGATIVVTNEDDDDERAVSP